MFRHMLLGRQIRNLNLRGSLATSVAQQKKLLLLRIHYKHPLNPQFQRLLVFVTGEFVLVNMVDVPL